MSVRRGEAGDALPTVFQPLEDRRIRFRRSQTMLLAAPPNSGKSLFALYYVIRLAQKGLKSLVFSADTDAHDTKMRATAMVTGDSVETIEQAYYTESGAAYYDDALEDLQGVRFDFADAPSFDDIEEGLRAFAELWGEYPALLVIDNLGNLNLGYEDEWRGLKEATRGLKHVARATGAHTLILHHVNETVDDPVNPASRKNIAGKVTQFVEGAMTIALDDNAGVMRIASVKNRGGKKDASGKNFAELLIDGDKLQFYRSTYDKQQGNPI